ncbi:MAG: endonuclease/exonuclease/phosphatase family protein [Ruminococcaceae bacterium]|nr:endonuclease/exonuclease/phosphatase family protein [Oscillospiraceae bacterium]
MTQAKRIVVFLLALSLLLSFVSCNKESPEETEESEALSDTEEKTEAPTEKKTEKKTSKPTEKKQEYLFSLNFGSYNIANGRNVGHDLTKLGEDIKNADIDVVGLQEVDQFVARSGNQDTMKILSESSGLPYYRFFKAIDHQGGEYGVGILSRYPILEYESQQLHSPNLEQRVLGHALIDIDGTHVDFFVTHLSYENAEIHAIQTEAVIEKISQYENFVLTGDFNTESFDPYYIENRFGALNNGAYKVPTFANQSIDNIIYRRESWKFGKPLALVNGHSDHNMLYATARFILK